MSKPQWVRSYRLIFAALTLAAIAIQCYSGLGKSNFSLTNFFSFFTIQSNLLAAAVLIFTALRPESQEPSRPLDLLRGAATLYMMTTGVVYGFLLAGYQEELQTTIPWVDIVVHRVMPLVMLADWVIEPPQTQIQFRQALLWLLYPLAYVLYSLTRGPLVDWYPYPFLDPSASGYAGVALYCVGIAAGILLGTWIVVLISQRIQLAWRT